MGSTPFTGMVTISMIENMSLQMFLSCEAATTAIEVAGEPLLSQLDLASRHCCHFETREYSVYNEGRRVDE